MCGISGFINFSKNIGSDDLNKYGLKMSLCLKKRGPDSFGVWSDSMDCIALSHRRLSILDLSKNANQPMTSKNKRYKIVFNGEIYNFIEIKKELQNKVNFSTSSDTEVLIESISNWGLVKTLKKVNGMFAFALWDTKKKKLYLVRDRVGIKPLYWYHDNNNFAFGSEVKAINALPWVNLELDKASLASYVRLNYVPAPNSIYKKLFKLMPGSYLEVNYKKQIEFFKYWSVQDCIVDNNQKELNHELLLENALRKSVKNQMISDVPLGVFLSGGIDSSLIATLAQQNSKTKINTFTIGFKETSYDEGKYAKKISKEIGTNHNEEYFSYSKLEMLIENLGEIYDEPFSDSSQLPTLVLSEMTRRKVTVALSGDGGDELYAGYYRYFMAEKFKNIIFSKPLIFRRFMYEIIGLIPKKLWNLTGIFMPKQYGGNNLGDKLLKLRDVINDADVDSFYNRIISNVNDVSDCLVSSKEKENSVFDKNIKFITSNQICRMQLLDFVTYLPDDILTKVDRASMNSSLEVRVPFLDNDVIELAWKTPLTKKISNGNGKIILRNILEKYISKRYFDRPKMGFGIPLDQILRRKLKLLVEHFLYSENIKKQRLFNLEFYQKRWKEHITGKRNWQFLIWNFLVFQIWYKRWMK